jgi:hypothetical protein
MSAIKEQVVRKTVSLPENLWKELGNYRFSRRFPTETAALADAVARGLRADAVLSAIADIATGRRKTNGKFSVAAARTFGDAPRVLDLVESEVSNWGTIQGLSLTQTQIQDKARQVYEAAGRMAGGQAAGGQAAILDVAVEGLIDWAMRAK